MIPTPGRVVEYTLSEQDVEQIKRRRDDARQSMKDGTVGNTGFVLHMGNDVAEGETYPMVITRTWGTTEGSSVNGQVLLDGNDTLWVTSVSEGDGPRHFRQFPRV